MNDLWSDSMSWLPLVGLLFVCLVMLVLVIWQRTRVPEEAERFRTNPRAGDRAGYMLHDRTFMVGEITGLRLDLQPPAVFLETERYTAVGYERRTDLWSMSALRWFPPGTALGITRLPADADGGGVTA